MVIPGGKVVAGPLYATGRACHMRKDHRSNPGLTARALEDRLRVRPNMVSIDPGDIHVGFVSWDHGLPDHLEEFTPARCMQVIESMASTNWLDLVVIEEWKLYPEMAQKMVGSDFPTCQLIGALRYVLDCAEIPYHLQPAQIKYPTMGVLRNARFKLISQRTGCSGHVQDAELHGWYFMIRGYQQFERDTGVSLERVA
jgi:hypothetical protein